MPLGGVICRIDSPLEIGVSLPNDVQHRLRGKREKQKQGDGTLTTGEEMRVRKKRI